MVITGLTRNQLYLMVPWVRIPPSPPKERRGVCRVFSFIREMGFEDVAPNFVCRSTAYGNLGESSGGAFDSKRRIPPSPPKERARHLPCFFFLYDKWDSKTWLQISCAVPRLTKIWEKAPVELSIARGESHRLRQKKEHGVCRVFSFHMINVIRKCGANLFCAKIIRAFFLFL